MIRENYLARLIKSYLKNTYIGRAYKTKLRLRLGKLFPKSISLDEKFPEVAIVKLDPKLKKIPDIGIHADPTEYNGYKLIGSYYLRYKRFLDNNDLDHVVIDLFTSDWLEQCLDLDIIIACYSSEPSRLHELEGKMYILEKFHGKICYPSSNDMWSYEDKVRLNYLFKEFNVPHVDTFMSNDYAEAIEYCSKASYPIISKIKTGSCSRGVEKIDNKKQALKIVKKNFGTGRKALWTYSFEKDYVYFQDFIKDATYDLRIFCVGDVVLGYRRKMKGNDFRASGSGILDRQLLPEDAIKIAIDLKEKWDTTILAVDFVDTNNSKEHLVIEASISFGLDYPEYLEKDGKRVLYQNTQNGLIFREGCVWIQDFITLELINKWNRTQAKVKNESIIHLQWKLQKRD